MLGGDEEGWRVIGAGRIGEGVSVRIFCKGHNWLYGRSPLCVMHMLWDDSVSRI